MDQMTQIPDYIDDRLALKVVISDDFECITGVPVYPTGTTLSAYRSQDGHISIHSTVPNGTSLAYVMEIPVDGKYGIPNLAEITTGTTDYNDGEFFLNSCPGFSGESLTVNWDEKDSTYISVYPSGTTRAIFNKYKEHGGDGVYTIRFSNNVSSINLRDKENVVGFERRGISESKWSGGSNIKSMRTILDYSTVKLDTQLKDSYEMEKVWMPNLRTIDSDGTFSGLYSLSNVFLPSLETISGTCQDDLNTFCGCVNISSMCLPSLSSAFGFSTNSNGNSGGQIFNFMTELRELFIPNLKELKRGSCRGCFNLKDVVANSVVEISEYCFEFCMSMERIFLPKVQNVGQYSFKDCLKLETVSFGDGIHELGDFVFKGCSSLKEIDLSWSTSMVQITEDTFSGIGSEDYVIMVPRNLFNDYRESDSWESVRSKLTFRV